MAEYIALIRKEDDSSFGVDFPDFPGCISGGETLDEAMQNSREALQLHVDAMRQDGVEIPAPSAVDAVRENPENSDAVISLVHLPPERSKSVRINITIDSRLLAVVDNAVQEFGLNRSALLSAGARFFINNVRTRPRSVVQRQFEPRTVYVETTGHSQREPAKSMESSVLYGGGVGMDLLGGAVGTDVLGRPVSELHPVRPSKMSEDSDVFSAEDISDASILAMEAAFVTPPLHSSAVKTDAPLEIRGVTNIVAPVTEGGQDQGKTVRQASGETNPIRK